MDFATQIRGWYEVHKRDLPWRAIRDPYFIWLSEVILQQTRVEQGRAYYERFVSTYPTVSDLATASETEVLKLWQGLGYYSRARNLHAAAQFIHQELNGQFPDTYKGIRALKGVGDYTAAAIGSFAFDLPHAVVDGNVYRVLSRLFNIDTPIDSTSGKKEFQQLAQELLGNHDPATFNQSMMEFGALQCVPRSPNCEVCPVAAGCGARKANRIGELPVKKGKTKVRDRYFYYAAVLHNQHTYLRQRTGKDVWQNLWEFPLIETPTALSESDLLANDNWTALFPDGSYSIQRITPVRKHVLSHQRIHTQFILLQLDRASEALDTNHKKLTISQVHEFPVSRLVELFLEEEATFR